MFHLRTCIMIFLSETHSVTVHSQYSWLRQSCRAAVYNLIIHISLADVHPFNQFAPSVLEDLRSARKVMPVPLTSAQFGQNNPLLMVWLEPKVMKDFPHVVGFVSCQFENEDIRFLGGNQRHLECICSCFLFPERFVDTLFLRLW